MRIALKFNKNSYVILSRLARWPYVRPWHKSCRSWRPLNLKLMLRPFMLTVHVGRDVNPASDVEEMLRWLDKQKINQRGFMPFDVSIINRALTAEEVKDDYGFGGRFEQQGWY